MGKALIDDVLVTYFEKLSLFFVFWIENVTYLQLIDLIDDILVTYLQLIYLIDDILSPK